jgi:hypothetical protein
MEEITLHCDHCGRPHCRYRCSNCATPFCSNECGIAAWDLFEKHRIKCKARHIKLVEEGKRLEEILRLAMAETQTHHKVAFIGMEKDEGGEKRKRVKPGDDPVQEEEEEEEEEKTDTEDEVARKATAAAAAATASSSSPPPATTTTTMSGWIQAPHLKRQRQHERSSERKEAREMMALDEFSKLIKIADLGAEGAKAFVRGYADTFHNFHAFHRAMVKIKEQPWAKSIDASTFVGGLSFNGAVAVNYDEETREQYDEHMQLILVNRLRKYSRAPANTVVLISIKTDAIRTIQRCFVPLALHGYRRFEFLWHQDLQLDVADIPEFHDEPGSALLGLYGSQYDGPAKDAPFALRFSKLATEVPLFEVVKCCPRISSLKYTFMSISKRTITLSDGMLMAMSGDQDRFSHLSVLKIPGVFRTSTWNRIAMFKELEVLRLEFSAAPPGEKDLLGEVESKEKGGKGEVEGHSSTSTMRSFRVTVACGDCGLYLAALPKSVQTCKIACASTRILGESMDHPVMRNMRDLGIAIGLDWQHAEALMGGRGRMTKYIKSLIDQESTTTHLEGRPEHRMFMAETYSMLKSLVQRFPQLKGLEIAMPLPIAMEIPQTERLPDEAVGQRSIIPNVRGLMYQSPTLPMSISMKCSAAVESKNDAGYHRIDLALAMCSMGGTARCAIPTDAELVDADEQGDRFRSLFMPIPTVARTRSFVCRATRLEVLVEHRLNMGYLLESMWHGDFGRLREVNVIYVGGDDGIDDEGFRIANQKAAIFGVAFAIVLGLLCCGEKGEKGASADDIKHVMVECALTRSKGSVNWGTLCSATDALFKEFAVLGERENRIVEFPVSDHLTFDVTTFLMRTRSIPPIDAGLSAEIQRDFSQAIEWNHQ